MKKHKDITRKMQRKKKRPGSGQRLTAWWFPSFPIVLEPWEAWIICSGEEKEGLGLNRCSKIAMIRNIDIKIAVATKPKEIAFMDVPKFFHGASRSTTGWEGLGSELVYMFQGFGLSELNSFMAVWWNLIAF